MKFLSTILLFLSSSLLFAQPAEYFFGNGRFHDIAPTQDGNYYLLGESEGKVALIKVSKNDWQFIEIWGTIRL